MVETSPPPYVVLLRSAAIPAVGLTSWLGSAGCFPRRGSSIAGAAIELAAGLEIRQHGIDPAHVIIEFKSRSTFENAVYTAQIVRPQRPSDGY